jgi:signal transduction histidine kinase
LLWKILVSTFLAITLLLAAAGWIVQRQTRSVLSENLRRDLEGDFRAYDALWQSRADTLKSVSLVLSMMSDVRAAFRTNDRATIRDTAAEIWSRVSESKALFIVTDPAGDVIASLGGGEVLGNKIDLVREAAARFPAQAAGFAVQGGRLYELVVTPVYVQMAHDSGLLNVLVSGFAVDETVARDLKEKTGGSDFVFVAGGKTLTSTLPENESRQIALAYRNGREVQELDTVGGRMAVLGSPLRDIGNAQAGELLIVHTFDAVSQSIELLESHLLLIWAAAVVTGLCVSALLAHRILQPIRLLDRAAARIAQQDYAARVPEGSRDELGRLARTFNTMCQSIQDAREELIRHERISTIGRLSSSIVHDLRNPLASIYGGAEMIMDGNLSDAQLHRVAGNIYRASRAVNEMLQELVNVSRGRIQPAEHCRLGEVVEAAIHAEAAEADHSEVRISAEVDPTIELPMERARMERLFINLIGNAIEAMPSGGEVKIWAERNSHSVLVHIEDTGPGIPAAVRERLFQPFVTARKNGLGLGLALARQTALDHGGDLWAVEAGAVETPAADTSTGNGHGSGARFCLRLPYALENEPVQLG